MLAVVMAAMIAVAGAKGPATGPYVVVLGTAQDGGLPQIGCSQPCCARARRSSAARRLVSSLLICDPRSGQRWLVDATPDLPAQVEAARDHPPTRSLDGPRPPLFEGVFLTHAHVGHYAGLLHLGREAYGARGLPVHATSRMRAFLTDNGPWSLLVSGGFIRLEMMEPDTAVRLAPDLSITPFTVPHRDEFSDTVGFLIEGPSRRVAFIPDIDKWEKWDRRIEDLIGSVDVALLDGTFFADGEIPGRAMSEIPHPFIVESLDRFASLPAEERAKVVFTHLNHTNPAARATSPAARRVRAAGMTLARDGAVLGL